MKKLLVVITLIIVALISGYLFYKPSTPSSEQQESQVTAPAPKASQKQDSAQSAPKSPEPTVATPKPAPAAQPGVYTDYNQGALADAKGTKILFFHASWCSQCRLLEKDIQAKGVPSGVTILKVDYDRNQTLRRQYGVTLQTTLVKLDANNNLAKKYVAYDEPTVESIKQNLLQ